MLITTGSETPVEQNLPQAIDRIVRELRPEKIILFGSYAYGDPTPDSDVDLLVIMETELPKRQRSWEVARLLIPRPFPVDVLVRTPEEIQHAFATGDFFIQEIVSKGKVLYERRH
jgi:predicted nucleotidyltransferase